MERPDLAIIDQETWHAELEHLKEQKAACRKGISATTELMVEAKQRASGWAAGVRNEPRRPLGGRRGILRQIGSGGPLRSRKEDSWAHNLLRFRCPSC